MALYAQDKQLYSSDLALNQPKIIPRLLEFSIQSVHEIHTLVKTSSPVIFLCSLMRRKNIWTKTKVVIFSKLYVYYRLNIPYPVRKWILFTDNIKVILQIPDLIILFKLSVSNFYRNNVTCIDWVMFPTETKWVNGQRVESRVGRRVNKALY